MKSNKAANWRDRKYRLGCRRVTIMAPPDLSNVLFEYAKNEMLPVGAAAEILLRERLGLIENVNH